MRKLSLLFWIIAAPLFIPFGSQAGSTVIQWGYSDGTYALTNVPKSATDVVAVAAGQLACYVLKRDGTVVAWGDSSAGQTNVPATITNISAISAGKSGCGGYPLAVQAGGQVVTWGSFSTLLSNIPGELTNARAIAPGGMHAIAVKPNGSMVCWGDNSYGQLNFPQELTNVVAVSASFDFSLALKSDGRVAAWGYNVYNNVGQTNVPAGLCNVVAISAGGAHSLALRSDGTVAAWGANESGQCSIPTGLSNVVAIAAGGSHSLALKKDGHVVAWGNSFWNRTNVPENVTNVVAISASTYQSLALVGDGLPFFSSFPVDQMQPAGGAALFCMPATGQFPLSYQWQLNGTNLTGATNWFLQLTNVQATDAGPYTVVVSNSVGVTISAAAHLRVVVPQFDFSPGQLQMSANGFQMQVQGFAGQGRMVIYASTNMIQWEPIWTNAPTSDPADFTDVDATKHAGRFYRAVEER